MLKEELQRSFTIQFKICETENQTCKICEKEGGAKRGEIRATNILEVGFDL